MRGWPYLTGGLALASAGLVLVASGPLSQELPYTRSLFTLSLVLAGVAAGVLARRKQWLPAGLILAAGTSLLTLSFHDWYVLHGEPDPTGFTHHTHTLWELGHVH